MSLYWKLVSIVDFWLYKFYTHKHDTGSFWKVKRRSGKTRVY